MGLNSPEELHLANLTMAGTSLHLTGLTRKHGHPALSAQDASWFSGQLGDTYAYLAVLLRRHLSLTPVQAASWP